MSFFTLPLEVRLEVYSQLFGDGITSTPGLRQDVGEDATNPDMLPATFESSFCQERSAQLLRTCKTILYEARPVLYNNTTFRTSFHAFAGRLPARITSRNASYPYIRQLEWSLDCDLLKKFDVMDVHIGEKDVQNLRSVKISCQAENWRDSYCGAWSDRQTFVRGRQQVLDFAKILQHTMSNGRRLVTIAEDSKYLGRGRVVVRVFVGKRDIGPDDIIID